jgi:uncharacterized protein YkwD
MRPVVPHDPVVPTPEVTPPVSMNAADRFRFALVGGTTAVVIGVGFTAIGLHQRAADDPSPRSAGVPLVAAAPPDAGAGAGTGGLLDDAASATTGAAAPTILPKSPSAAAPKASTSHVATSAKPKPHRTTSPTKKPATSTPGTSSAILTAVLADINAARDDAGLSALTLDADLSKASALHNQLMINGCGLEHQCPGEQSIGPRFSAQGVQWSSAGENIGFGSSGSSQSAIISAANGLTASMLAEKAPNDGHRRNLLSSSFKRIGLSVVRDGSGKTWMVQDFVN